MSKRRQIFAISEQSHSVVSDNILSQLNGIKISTHTSSMNNVPFMELADCLMLRITSDQHKLTSYYTENPQHLIHQSDYDV